MWDKWIELNFSFMVDSNQQLIRLETCIPTEEINVCIHPYKERILPIIFCFHSEAKYPNFFLPIPISLLMPDIH